MTLVRVKGEEGRWKWKLMNNKASEWKRWNLPTCLKKDIQIKLVCKMTPPDPMPGHQSSLLRGEKPAEEPNRQ